MQARTSGKYELVDRELISDGSDLRAQVLTLAAGQCVSWHYHSENHGHLRLSRRAHGGRDARAANNYVLTPGQRCAVPSRTTHYVHGEAQRPRKFLIVQGVGVYNFVPVGS